MESNDSENRFSEICEAFTRPAFLMDDEGRITHVNAAGEDLLDMNREEIVDQYVDQILRDGENESVDLSLISSFTSGTNQERSFFCKTGNGETINVRGTVHPIRRNGQTRVMLEVERADQTTGSTSTVDRNQLALPSRTLFDQLPVAVLLEDLSETKAFLDDLKQEGIKNLESFFKRNPETLKKAVKYIDVLSVNQKFLDIINAGSETHLINDRKSVYREETYHTLQDGLISLYEKGHTTYSTETTLKTLDGKVRHVIIKLNIVDGHEEDWSRVLVSAVDITEQKHRELHNRSRSMFLEKISSQFPGVLYEVEDLGEDLEFTFVGEGYEEFGSVVSSELSFPESMSDIHPEDRDRVREEISTVIRQRESFQTEYRYLKDDGSVVWVRVQSEPYKKANGRYAWIGAIIDITEQKETEKALRENEERFRQFAEFIGEVFWMTDTTKKEMIYISPAYEDIWGRLRDELYDDPFSWLESIHPEDRSRIEEIVPEKQLAGEYDEEYRILRPDGEQRWIRDRAYPIENDDGDVYRLVGIAEDITERKEAKQALEEALDEKEVLLEEIHHRVKNNLQVVSSMLRMQANLLPDSADARKHLEESQLRIRAMGMIHEHLYNAGVSGQVSVDTYVRELVDEILTIHWREDREPKVEYDIDEDANLEIDQAVSCGLIFNEMVTNVLTHAFTEDEEDPRLKIGFDVDDECRMYVEDNGRGLPDQFAAEETDSLGMKILRSMADQLNGHLSVEDTENTRFSVHFPA